MSSQAEKGALFDAFASVAAALGSGRRAEIVDVRVRDAQLKVEEAAVDVGLFDPEDPGATEFDDR